MKLTSLEARWLQALMEGFAPIGSGDECHLAPEQDEVDFVGTFHEMNRVAGFKARYGVRAAVALMALSPLWADGRLRSMASLRPEERVELLARLSGHRLQLVRELVTLMKVQVSMALLRVPTVRARSGFDRGREEGTPVRLRLRSRAVATTNESLESGERRLDDLEESELAFDRTLDAPSQEVA